jgi:hypothetical protein
VPTLGLFRRLPHMEIYLAYNKYVPALVFTNLLGRKNKIIDISHSIEISGSNIKEGNIPYINP